MNKHLIELYERQIKNIEGSRYFGIKVDMDNPKEVAAMMYALGHTKGSNQEIEQKHHEFNILLGK
jgi:hypothetical protein